MLQIQSTTTRAGIDPLEIAIIVAKLKADRSGVIWFHLGLSSRLWAAQLRLGAACRWGQKEILLCSISAHVSAYAYFCFQILIVVTTQLLVGFEWNVECFFFWQQREGMLWWALLQEPDRVEHILLSFMLSCKHWRWDLLRKICLVLLHQGLRAPLNLAI